MHYDAAQLMLQCLDALFDGRWGRHIRSFASPGG